MDKELQDIALAIMLRQEQDPLYFYRPTRKQREFHEAKADRVFFLAANSTGKTTSIDYEIALAMTGRHWVKGKWPVPPVELRLGTEKEMAVEIHTPLLKRLLAPYLKPGFPHKGGTQVERKWVLNNGSTLDIMLYGQEDKRWEGVPRHGVFFDEPFRESIWKATAPRMRRGHGGRIVVGMTMLADSAWISDKILEATDEIDSGLSYDVIEADIWSNCKCLTPIEHDDFKNGIDCQCNGGFIHRFALDKMIAEWDEEERDARMFGRSVRMRDRAFPNFNANAHVLAEDMTPREVAERRLRLYVACDPHPRRPPAWGLYGFDDDGIFYILDEFPNIHVGLYKSFGSNKPFYYNRLKSYDKDYNWTVRTFQEIEQMWGGKVVARFIDPRHGNSRLANTNQLVHEAYARAAQDAGFDMRFHSAIVGGDVGETEIASGILLIKNKLAYDPSREIGAGNMPMLFVNPRCANHIRSLQFLKYKNITGKAADGRAVVEVLEEDHKDFADLLRYILKSVRSQKVNRAEERRVEYNYSPTNRRTGY